MGNQEQLDQKVKDLIQQALQYTPDSLERKKRIKALLDLIDYLPEAFSKERLGKFKGMRSYYDDALNTTADDITKNLERYIKNYGFDIVKAEPENIRRCFVKCHKMIIIGDLQDKWKNRNSKYQPKFVNDELFGQHRSITRGEMIRDTERLSPIEQAIFDDNKHQQKLLWDYVRQDPEEILRNCYSKKYPNCTCWELCKRRFLNEPKGETLKEIAQALGIESLRTVKSHFDRRCKPLLKEIGKKFGFEGE
ncbi:MAG: hypothetical protein KI793_21330 [Rivularia sp. (in: Bacteria)]|nr:hypothetical protein [Rivularia sp. MS3]